MYSDRCCLRVLTPALLVSKAKLLLLALGTWWIKDHVLDTSKVKNSTKTIARSSMRWRGRTFRFSLHDPAPWGHTVLPDCACTSFRSAPLWRRVGESSSCPIRRPSRTSPSGQASRQSIPRSMGRVSADMTNCRSSLRVCPPCICFVCEAS